MTDLAADTLFGMTDPLPTHGRHMGFVRIPYSSNHSAYGFVPLPIAVVGGDPGPTVLLLAGVSGDEFAAQVGVAEVLRSLDPSNLRGRVIGMTMANFPAAKAGTRNSPLDGQNLNRSFPGNVLGTLTSLIADYIERHLMATADLVLDLQSEGRSQRYLTCATMVDHPDADVQERRIALASAFGFSNVIRFPSFDHRTTSGAAWRAGATRVGAEIGADNPVETIVEGVNRVLAWAGMTPEIAPTSSEPRLLLTHPYKDFIFALSDGVFEPVAQLDDRVEAGDLAGNLYDLTRPLAPPVPVTFPVSGTVVCTRGRGPALRGDCLMHLAMDADANALSQFGEAAQLRWLSTQYNKAKKPRAKTRGKPADEPGGRKKSPS